MKVIGLAVIIPTLNEEHFIGRLLDSIISQTAHPGELVVVDAYSEDKTIEEVKKRQKSLPALRYFQIPKSTVSRQRNFGVKKTNSPHILFLDADMEFKQKDDLEKYFNEVLKENPDVASATTLPDSSDWKDLIYFKAEDLSNKLLKYFWPGVTARNLYIRRKIFESAGGFDEEIAAGEDYELVYRIVKKRGKLIFLNTVRLYTSTRRLDYEGRKKFVSKVILFGLNILLHGWKKARIKYEFGIFTKP